MYTCTIDKADYLTDYMTNYITSYNTLHVHTTCYTLMTNKKKFFALTSKAVEIDVIWDITGVSM